jgi:glycosyltransferase involved in cell wall biosynthesis
MAANIFSSQPYTVARYDSAEARSRLKQILARHSIDVVHFDLPHVATYLKDVGHLPKILTNHNVESLRLQRWARLEKNPLARLYLYYQYRKLHRYESRLCQCFEQCITVSEVDKRVLKKMCQSNNFTTVPNGVDVDYFRPRSSKDAKSEGIVWVGSMGDVNNRDAVDYFLTDIVPRVFAGLPRVTITFVGASPTRLLQKMASENGNIRIAGYVNDIRPYVDEAAVFIAPLRSGSGTKLKVLNAMAQAKPVVTTSIGAEGIEAIPGEEIVIADEPQEFADRVIALVENPEMAREIGLRARKCIESLYDWKSITASMNAIYEAARLKKRS